MSPLSLLVVASLVAALAFFAAGLLLASARSPRKSEGHGQTSSSADASLRRELAAAAQALADVRQRHESETSARKQEEARRREAERERDRASAELAEHASREQTLAERLRVAEDENRAAFKREEEAAEMWAGQLDATKVEQRRHDQALEREVAKLRAELATTMTVREKQATGTSSSAAARVEAATADVELLRARAEEAERQAAAISAERDRLAKTAEEAAVRAKGALERLASSESATRAKLDELEASWQGRLAAAESAWTARLSGTMEDLQGRLATAESERQALQDALAREQVEQATAEEERQTLALRVRAAEEVAEQRRQEAVAAAEARRGAEAKVKDYDRLMRENTLLREQQAEAEQEAQAQAGREVETRDAKVELAAAQAKLAELEHILEENRRLRDEAAELRTHQQASAELERLQAAHKQVRLDAELMARRLQELLHERAELLPLRAQAAEAGALAQEVEYLRRREKDLEAQIYAGGSFASRELPMLSGEIPTVAPGTDLETILGVMVGKGGPRTAVLADAQGFLIASAGESVTQEGLAAFAAVAGEMVARARMLLPLADVDTVRVTDANRMMLSCHLFASAGEGLGMATLGPGEPAPEDAARTIAHLAAIVAGAGPAEQSDPEPVQLGDAEPTTPAPT